MAYTVTLKRSAEKELDDLPARIRTKIVNIFLSFKGKPLRSKLDPAVFTKPVFMRP